VPERRPGLRFFVILAVVALAGCNAVLGGTGTSTPAETLTPAPIPEVTTAGSPTATPTESPRRQTLTVRGQARGVPGTPTPANGTRWATLRPDCDRPPGLVVQIQVSALVATDSSTDVGIRTAWRFAAPSNRRVTGPYADFRRMIREYYRPLLTAETVSFGRANRSGDVARQRVTVADGNGTRTSYRWSVVRQEGGGDDGCWMTTSVVELSPSG
jgi:hypothetical protein